MDGCLLTVRGEAAQVKQTFESAAVAGGFTVTPVDPWTLKAQKGNMAMSIFLGAFIAYCDFTGRISTAPDGSIQLAIERNKPWWTGLIGVNRVKNACNSLGDDVQRALGAACVGRQNS